jgi:adenylate kinase family enzyme
VDFKEYSELFHYGIKGMHWGIRRYQNPDGTLTDAGKIRNKVLKNKDSDISKMKRNRKDYNLDKWGKSENTNILWITGISGSGKSTVANDIAKKNKADVINIDLYTFKTADKYTKDMSKDFNKFLDKNVPNWKRLQKEGYEALTKTDRRAQKAAGKWFDTFQDALEQYGRESYGKKKVVAEGVQILDETLFYNNKKALKNQPLIIMKTSVADSILSRMQRDNKSLDKLLEPDRLKQLQGFVQYQLQLIDEMK